MLIKLKAKVLNFESMFFSALQACRRCHLSISMYKGFVTNPKYPNEKVHQEYINWLIHIIMLELHDWLCRQLLKGLLHI